MISKYTLSMEKKDKGKEYLLFIRSMTKTRKSLYSLVTMPAPDLNPAVFRRFVDQIVFDSIRRPSMAMLPHNRDEVMQNLEMSPV